MKIKNVKALICKELKLLDTDPFLESDIIISHSINKPKTFIYSYPDFTLNKNQVNKIKEICRKRIANKPLAYLINKKEFYNNSFFVDENVLIPRPDSELLVEYALKFINSNKKKNQSLLEIGTGSGCLSISILKNVLQKICITATDINLKSLSVAKKNILLLCNKKEQKQIQLIKNDIFNDSDLKKYNIIISNPPYIPSSLIKKLPVEIGANEPYAGLDGGYDGLKYYRKFLKIIPNLLKKNGIAIFEIFSDNSKKIYSLFEKGLHKKKKVEIIKDYACNSRLIIIKI